MRYFLLLIGLVTGWFPVAWASPAHAAGVPDSAVLAEACYWLEHAQVGRDAAYVPGVDAYGREVVPADTGRRSLSPPEMLEFDIRVDLADDLPPGSLPVDAFQTIAHISLNTTTGELFIDGTRVGSDEEIDLEAHCAEATSQ